EEDISLDEAYDNASIPIKEFMSQHTRQKDLALFLNYTDSDKPESIVDISLITLVPAFTNRELKTAFQMGFMIFILFLIIDMAVTIVIIFIRNMILHSFMIFIPFLIIDMAVASVLMYMGMMMLPPVMISLPFKILLFVLVDGWYLISYSLLQGY